MGNDNDNLWFYGWGGGNFKYVTPQAEIREGISKHIYQYYYETSVTGGGGGGSIGNLLSFKT